MTHQQKLDWLGMYAAKIGGRLVLDGECGFGRECVGIERDQNYPDYPDDAPVTAPHAYHKHNCLAVLGRGSEVEAELYDWCKALESDGFDQIEVKRNPECRDILSAFLGQGVTVRLIRSKGKGAFQCG